jgi:tetratricopeptide (TPR) repeat protein
MQSTTSNLFETSLKEILDFIYTHQLQVLQKIHFTRREIEIVACLMNGRHPKGIADLLSLSPRTIEVHIYNIFKKLGVNSKERLITLLEKTRQSSDLKKFYGYLSLYINFEKGLKTIASLLSQKNTIHLVSYKENPKVAFLKDLEVVLKKVGFKTFFLIVNNPSSKTAKLEESPDAAIYFLSNPKNNEFIKVKDKNYQHPFLSKVIYLIEEDIEPLSENVICCPKYGSKEALFLEILKRIVSQTNIKKIFEELLAYSQALEAPFSSLPSIEKIKKTKYSWALLKSFSYHHFLGALIFCFGSILLFKGTPLFSPFEKSLSTKVHSDLLLPNQASFLERPALIGKIHRSFKFQKGIQTVALIGMGGMGKTTLARQYAHSQDMDLVWELNAETLESLDRSFEALAESLTKTEEDRTFLQHIKEIKEYQERSKKIIAFVKQRFKRYPCWLLIYDNVEDFTGIQAHLPSDANLEREGRIIITTRNHNIANNRFITNAIKIEELSSQEKLSLFIKIIGKEKLNTLNLTQKEEIKKLLSDIPPFPLDISMAAYYILATNISLEDYLSHLREGNEYFSFMQKNILKGITNYNETRYTIISASLREFFKTHQDFKPLLLFISMVDSQNIPFDLLTSYKNKIVVGSFIYNLKKYSFITDKYVNALYSIPSFSIHRSTQEISLAYLTQSESLGKNSPLIQEIVHSLENYAAEVISKEDTPKMKALVIHYKHFLNHTDLLMDTAYASLSIKLGSIYFFLGDYDKAKELLTKGLMGLNKDERKYSTQIAYGLMHLGMVYRKLGNYKKARKLLEESLSSYNKDGSQNYKEIALALEYLGMIFRNLGEYKKGKECLQQGLKIYKTHYPENYAAIARASIYLGYIHKDLGDYKEAEKLLMQGLLLYTKHSSSDHTGIARGLVYLANVHRELGNYEKAKNLLEQSLEIFKKHFPESHTKVAWVLVSLGNVYKDLGKYDKAKNCFEKSSKIYGKYFGNSHVKVALSLINLGDVYKQLGKYREAKDLITKNLPIYEKSYEINHMETARALMSLGEIFLLEEDYKNSEILVNKGLYIAQLHHHPEFYKSFESLSNAYLLKHTHAQAIGNTKQAYIFKNQGLKFLRLALEIVKSYFPNNSFHVSRIENKLRTAEGSVTPVEK